jgi:hypothetical protein
VLPDAFGHSGPSFFQFTKTGTLKSMKMVTGTVRGNAVLLDEPLPEGSVVEVRALGTTLAEQQELIARAEDSKHNPGISAEEMLERLRLIRDQ